MKAIITNDEGNVSALKLRLVAEGANDRTLMLLLELQCPMIYRQSSLANYPYLPEALEIPIASPQILPLKTSSELSLCFKVKIHQYQSWYTVISDPWEHATMTGARLRILHPEDWEVKSLAINGRYAPVDQPCTVHPGGIVTLVVQPLREGSIPESFEGFLEVTDPAGPTCPLSF